MECESRYKIDEVFEGKFCIFPKDLFFLKKYENLNSDAKLIYMLLNDRKELSRKNNWVNKKNEIYLIYTIEELSKMIRISNKTTIKAMQQLQDCGLVQIEKQGLNKPNKIFVCKINSGKEATNGLNTGSVNSTLQEVKILHTSDTYISKTETLHSSLIKEIDISNNSSINSTICETVDVVLKNEPRYSFEQIKEFKSDEFEYEDPYDTKGTIEYFLESYEQHKNEPHPPMQKIHWNEIVKNINKIKTEMYDPITNKKITNILELHKDGMSELIDFYFNNEFKVKIDYRISHFNSDGIKSKMFYKT